MVVGERVEDTLSKIIIKSIHDTDLEKVLKKLRVYHELIEGKHQCSICGGQVTLENLGGIYMENGELRFICNRIECLVKAVEKLSRKTQAINSRR